MLDVVPILQRTRTYFLAQRIRDSLLLKKRIKFYSQFIRPGDLCFDVGANLGNRTETFLRLGARVVAIEPNDECKRHLTWSYGNRPDVILGRKAVGSQNGPLALNICTHIGASSMSQEWIESVVASRRFPRSVKWDK